MKASELIEKLQQLVATEGDLLVGVSNSEFSIFEPIVDVAARDRTLNDERRWGDMFDDSESLGQRFIGIS